MPGEGLTTQVHIVSAAGAKVALAAAERAAIEKGLRLGIAIVDNAGLLVACLRMDGAPVTTIEAALRKARTAAQLGAPSKAFQDLVDGGMSSLLTFEFLTPCQGGVPLTIDGAVVGGIACSGGSGEEDEMVAGAGASALSAAASG